MRAVVRKLWTGAFPLPQAFWDYAIFRGFLLNLATTMLSLAFLATKAPAALAVAAHALPVPYNVLVLVAVWRSANNYHGRPLWGTLARFSIVLWTIMVSLL